MAVLKLFLILLNNILSIYYVIIRSNKLVILDNIEINILGKLHFSDLLILILSWDRAVPSLGQIHLSLIVFIKPYTLLVFLLSNFLFYIITMFSFHVFRRFSSRLPLENFVPSELHAPHVVLHTFGGKHSGHN